MIFGPKNKAQGHDPEPECADGVSYWLAYALPWEHKVFLGVPGSTLQLPQKVEVPEDHVCIRGE